jgi:sulfatase maturation enzyme AslB (radical SAM superfamily)
MYYWFLFDFNFPFLFQILIENLELQILLIGLGRSLEVIDLVLLKIVLPLLRVTIRWLMLIFLSRYICNYYCNYCFHLFDMLKLYNILISYG